MALSCSKTLFALLGEITSKNNGDKKLYSFRTKNKFKYAKKKDFCNIFMPSEDIKILEFNQYQNVIKHC